MATIQAMLSTNPVYKEILPMIEKNHGDYKKTFLDLAQQKGIDVEAFLNSLNTSVNNLNKGD